MAYVYRHIRLDTNKVFYVGISRDEHKGYKRMFSEKGRSQYWKSIKNKTAIKHEIYLDGISWDEACSVEKTLIKIYGRTTDYSGDLCNLTIGGEGIVGYVLSEEQKITRSRNAKKRLSNPQNHPMYGKKHSDESLQKMSNSKKGLIPSEKTKDIWRKNRSGGGNSRAKMVLNIQNGIFYDCIKDAAYSLGINYGTLKNRLIGKLKNSTNFITI
jgi:hypothetical protein